MIRLAVAFAAGRCEVVAGTGANATAEAIELTAAAEQLGATGSLQVCPYYNKPSQEGLYLHFKAIAGSTRLPIMLYSVPGRSVIEISPETTARLAADFPNITAIKEAGGSVDRVNQLVQALPDDFAILCGDDPLTLPFIACGATGLVSVASNLIPDVIARLGARLPQRLVRRSPHHPETILSAHARPDVARCQPGADQDRGRPPRPLHAGVPPATRPARRGPDRQTHRPARILQPASLTDNSLTIMPKLFIPGPIDVSKETFAAMSQPMIGHRGGEFEALYASTQPGLQELGGTTRPFFLSTSSAWGVMEASLRNLCAKKVLTLCCGAFSDKWYDVAKSMGLNAEKIQVEWGEAIAPEAVRAKLAEGGFDLVTLIHNETSTGVMNDLAGIAKVVKSFPGVLFVVDSVSSFSAVPIGMDELGIDVLLAGVQKALALPPGLAVFACSEAALERAKSHA